MPSIAHTSRQGHERVTLAKVAYLYLHMQGTRVVEWEVGVQAKKPRCASSQDKSANVPQIRCFNSRKLLIEGHLMHR